jgi:hypothetical protein
MRYVEQTQVPGNYYRMWQRRDRPFMDDDWILSMEFSPRYFAELKRELESAGYEVTVLDHECQMWYSAPVGYFFVSDALKGESFVFIVM